MTPLAQAIVRELMRPVKSRSINDPCGLLRRLDDVHCFDVSEIVVIATDMILYGGKKKISEPRKILSRIEHIATKTSFLPAPKTWVEWRVDDGGRVGYLLEENSEGVCVCRAGRSLADGRLATGKFAFSFGLGENWELLNTDEAESDDIADQCQRAVIILHAIMAFINTPRIIGRRQHMPHRGLEKALVAQKKMVGQFPLHAWTEILLHVTPPKDASTEDSHEAHLTGERALHFCRAHLRIRLGQLEIVRAHWRGDPALGIVQSRYKVVA